MTPPFLGAWELPHFSHSTELQQQCSLHLLPSEAELIGLRRTPHPEGQLQFALEWRGSCESPGSQTWRTRELQDSALGKAEGRTMRNRERDLQAREEEKAREGR